MKATKTGTPSEGWPLHGQGTSHRVLNRWSPLVHIKINITQDMQAASEVGGKKVNLLDPITLAVALIQTEVSDAPIPVRVMEVLAGRQSFSSFSLIFIPYKKKIHVSKTISELCYGNIPDLSIVQKYYV